MQPRYPDFIDHIVLGASVASRLQGFVELGWSGEALSDHCMIVAELN